MTAVRGGTPDWGQVPKWNIGAGTEMQNQQYGYSDNVIVSANEPIIYQIIWGATSPDSDEMYVPSIEGDIVNCVFKVYTTTEYPTPTGFGNWDLIGTIKKSRDLPNTNIVNANVPNNQRYTIDISRLVSDQLSYSLCPIGKGSWQSQEYGGMNGGARKQDNITETVSPYNVTRNGSYRAVAVTANFEVLDSNLQIVTSSSVRGAPSYIRALNTAPTLGQSPYFFQSFTLREVVPAQKNQMRALTRCPNSQFTGAAPNFLKKPVNITDQAEFLQFFVERTDVGSYNEEVMNLYEVYGTAYYNDGTSDTNFVLGSLWSYPIDNDPTTIGERIQSDISHNFEYNTVVLPNAPGDKDTQFNAFQMQNCVQNVSPAYINGHAYPPQNETYPYSGAQFSPITSGCTNYRVYVRAVFFNQQDGSDTWQTQRKSNFYHYKINKEDELTPYESVKFHWLNTMGGIDSYIARRDVLESMVVEKSIMETKRAGRRFIQDDRNSSGADLTIKDYYSDTMRGFDTYKGGLEVLSVDANVKNSVYTEPLNKVTSTWLREMFSSPNVWVEKKAANSDQPEFDQDFPDLMGESNPDLRPSSTIYSPVIINNTEIVSLDQSLGLVKYNIEYTESFGVLTQRN